MSKVHHRGPKADRVVSFGDLMSDSPTCRTALSAIAFDEGGQRLRAHDTERSLKIATKYPALPLLIKFADLPLNVHGIDIDETGVSRKTAGAFELKCADTHRHDRPHQACLFQGLLCRRLMRGEAWNGIALRYDPLAAAATGHQIELEASIGGKLYGQGGNLAIHGN